MLTPPEIRKIEDRCIALAEYRHVGDAKAAIAASLDMLLPPASISITECAVRHRLFPGPDGKPVKWLLERTPYVAGIQDCCDEIGVEVVAVQGNARSGKTVGAENLCLRNWIYGPSLNVIWYMQSKSDVDDYVEERVEWMLSEHEQIASKINFKNRRQSRARKRIGTSLARWLPATRSTTRGKAAPIIIADEIDGYVKNIRKAIMTLLRNRQREFGTAALLYLASHPDVGPDDGVASVIAEGLKHEWWFPCMECEEPVSFNQYASSRMHWNVPTLIKQMEGLERPAMIEKIGQEAKLVCPHCGCMFGDNSRLEMSSHGQWIQPHQKLNKDGTVTGVRKIATIMGFEIHAMMSPFVKINELAKEWAAAWLKFQDTSDDTQLKEVNVKSLGEIHTGTDEAEQQEPWKVVRNRLRTPYKQKTVPEGVQFLTAFVDIQGDRFEVVVIGWNVGRESWLIDRFPIKQWPGFENIDPANRLTDWKIIEAAVLNQSYPLERDPRYHMPIARVAVDTGGAAGDDDGSVTQNARLWAQDCIGRKHNPIESWHIMLTKGAAGKTGELYGKPKRFLVDDQNKPLENAPWERVLNVHEIKRIIIKRMKIAIPGPGMMHIPLDMKDRYVIELVAEKLINGQWISQGHNETWDGWVACDAARASLAPEREGIDWINAPPVWARPFLKAEKEGIDMGRSKPVSYFDRLIAMNTKSTE